MSQRKATRQTSGRGARPVETAPPVDPKLKAVADWLRNEKRSHLHTKEAVLLPQEARVECFRGSKLVDALTGNRYKGKVAKDMPINTRGEAGRLGQELLRVGYIEKSRKEITHRKKFELILVPGAFDEDSYYTWMYEGSKTKLYLMCAGMLIGALGLCMIQIWPLWLKIGVWWCSVTFLTTFGVLCVVRVVLFALMWIVGFRGIWLFPNLFDDNQTFAGSFMPIFGKGDPIVEEEDSDEEYWEQVRKKKKKDEAAKDDKAADGTAPKSPEKVKPKSDTPKEKQPEPAFQFGWINVILIFGIGAIACVKLGLFDGDNVPDFVAKRDDLQYYFKSLAAPEPPNETEAKANGEPERDPFASPD